jgi:hypothetical protein
VPVEGSEVDLPPSVAVIEIGAGANPLIQSTHDSPMKKLFNHN